MRTFLVVSLIALAVVALAQREPVNLLDYKSITYKVNFEGRSTLTMLQVEKKAGGYEVSYTVKFTVQDEIDYEYFSAPYLYIMLSYMNNPDFLPFFQAIDVDRPATVSVYGAKIVYEGDERVGKYTGKRFSLYTDNQKVFSWVMGKDAELVLKFEVTDQDYSVELVNFRK